MCLSVSRINKQDAPVARAPSESHDTYPCGSDGAPLSAALWASCCATSASASASAFHGRQYCKASAQSTYAMAGCGTPASRTTGLFGGTNSRSVASYCQSLAMPRRIRQLPWPPAGGVLSPSRESSFVGRVCGRSCPHYRCSKHRPGRGPYFTAERPRRESELHCIPGCRGHGHMSCTFHACAVRASCTFVCAADGLEQRFLAQAIQVVVRSSSIESRWEWDYAAAFTWNVKRLGWFAASSS